MHYQRRLPHIWTAEQPIFLTWRLHGSLPPHRVFPGGSLASGQAFAALDRLLDEARTGPFHLRRPALADMVVEALSYNSSILRHYVLHAFVVMPNHVHLLLTPEVPLPQLTKSLKGITAKRANRMLALTGSRFWQEESYDHLVRNEGEFQRIRRYIEENPIRAGLVGKPAIIVGPAPDGRPGGPPYKLATVRENPVRSVGPAPDGRPGGRPRTGGSAPPSAQRWSSAGWATRGVARGPGGPPHHVRSVGPCDLGSALQTC